MNRKFCWEKALHNNTARGCPKPKATLARRNGQTEDTVTTKKIRVAPKHIIIASLLTMAAIEVMHHLKIEYPILNVIGLAAAILGIVSSTIFMTRA